MVFLLSLFLWNQSLTLSIFYIYFIKIFLNFSILINSIKVKITHWIIRIFFKIVRCLRYKLYFKLMVPNKLIM